METNLQNHFSDIEELDEFFEEKNNFSIDFLNAEVILIVRSVINNRFNEEKIFIKLAKVEAKKNECSLSPEE